MSPAGPAASGSAAEAEEVFRRAAADLDAERDRQAARRPELSFEDVPAPRRLAPHAAALAAAVVLDGAEIATGRLVLLFDPAGQAGWPGRFRIVAQIQAELDPEIAVDPLLGQVGWSWLTEALDTQDAQYAAPSGTVTRVVTEGFGAKSDDPAMTAFELRASWSPAEEVSGPVQPAISGHVAAWCDALCAAAGLAPPVPGVSMLPPAAKPRAPRAGGRGHDGLRSRDVR